MPLGVNQIGTFVFRILRGEIGTISERVEVISRLGVDGVALRRRGRRAGITVLVSIVDVPNIAAGHTLFEGGYSSLAGEDPVAVIQNSTSKGLMTVKGVRLLSLRASLNVSNPLNPPSLAILRCAWDLERLVV